MSARSWERPVGDGADARVTLEPDGSAGAARYRVAFPFLVGDQSAADVQVTGTGTLEAHHVRSDAGRPVSDIEVSLPDEADLERLIVRSRPERIVVHLPSPALLETADRARDGDAAALDALVERFPSPVQIPMVCGSFLGPDDTLDLTQELVRHDRHVQSTLHAYRYAIVRGALVSRAGLHVRTYGELLDLVGGLDAIPEIGSVGLVDALADVMATVHDTPAETERLLDELGVDAETLHERDEGRFTACLLAHIAVSSGVEAALAYEVPRNLPPRGHYDRRKRGVFRADYGDRGPAWRRLLNAARRRSDDEVAEVLAHTLYWTGEESRSDSRMAELLLRGAALVAEHAGRWKVERRARFGRLVAAGHRLRGTHCWGPSIANFEAARELAAEHAFLPAWKPVLARGLVRSRQLSVAGEHERAVGVLDRTLEAFLGADPPQSVANQSTRHLRAQKCEIEAKRHTDEAPGRAHACLEEARRLYDVIGYERSRERIERQLASLEAAHAVEASAAPGSEPPAGVPGVETERPPPAVAEADAPADGAVPDELGEDWLERLDYGDEDDRYEAYEGAYERPSRS
ncbi:MAG: hypothetical protein ABEJ92_05800 [Halobacteriales archaeon]